MRILGWFQFAALLVAEGEAREEALSNLRSQHRRKNLTVQDGELCSSAVNRLRRGPALWEDIISKGELYTDESFEGMSSIYWWGLDLNFEFRTQVDDNFKTGYYKWDRLGSLYPGKSLWVTNPTFTDSDQGQVADCYFMAAISAVAEFPDLIKKNFLTQSVNSAGIYAFKFFIRNKPWIVTIDDQLVVDKYDRLVFGGVGPSSHLWGPLIEKAWAKVQGSFGNAHLGFFQTGVEAVLGCPGFNYLSTEQDNQYSKVWQQLYDANSLNYILGAGTIFGPGEDVTEQKGMVHKHQYVLYDVFTLKDGNGDVAHRMFMLRNPWARTNYRGPWSKDDSRWTTAFISQLPYGTSPANAAEDGVFFVEDTDFLSTFGDYQIMHYRNDEGYENSIYDQDNDELGLASAYWVDLPSNIGDLYVTVETYFLNQIPSLCLGYKFVTFWVTFNDKIFDFVSIDFDQFSKPILIPESSYKAGDKLTIWVKVFWLAFPIDLRDYTIRVYSKQALEVKDILGENKQCHMDGTTPSCFTVSSYRADNKFEIPPPPKTLLEVFETSYDWKTFWSILLENWWAVFWWF